MKPGPKPRPIEDRFWPKVAKGETCWEWNGHKNNRGYGMFYTEPKSNGDPRMSLAHRVSYELVKGAIPAGLSLDHLCRNVACVNPDHLDPVTHKENMRRGITSNSALHPTAIKNRAKNHCPRGHPYDEINTYTNTRGQRCCKICKNASTSASHKRRKEQCRT